MKVEEFYKELFQEIKSTQASEEAGGIQEQIFTQLAIDLLADAGETENARICFDRKEDKLGRTMHKLNGYALSENYETLDLFVTVFKGVEDPFTLTKQEVESSINQVERFFRNAVYKDYIKELEESSEVFDLAHTLAEVKEVREFLSRVNIFVLSNGVFKSDIKANKTISGYSIFTRIIDIGYLFNLSDQTHVPIEINFENYGGILPCLESPSENDDYESYLALIPGATLANIYEEYGSRLLEQNVRSFLQFTGKINKGIRKTIKEEPHMFLAFNNGIAATADELNLQDMPGGGKAIVWAKDFQIVNGGQTTASVYHTWKKDKAEIDKIFVQTKLTVVKKRDNFNEIVNRIAEYANTQNKVSTSDLSSNKPFHVELEKISRSVWAQPVEGSNIQTRWFYERARGQYKNARLKEGFTPSRRKAFDLKNPRSQMITKELLAKYVNTYQEIWNGKRLAIGPHVVVRGSQKNYVQFLNYNMPVKPDNVFYEDAIAKAILFKNAEKLYGVSPNAIGDMRYITVPYSLSLLSLKTDYKIDLYKIWKNQGLSEKMKSVLFNLMESVETFIKKNAPGALYGEWAKKEECWNTIKENEFGIDFNELKSEFINNATPKRKSITEDEVNVKIIEQEIELIKSISSDIWDVIEKWGAKTGKMSKYLQDIALNISVSIKNNRPINVALRTKGISIIEIIIHEAPEILENEVLNKPISAKESTKQIVKLDVDLIAKMVEWDSRVKILSSNQRSYVSDFAYGLKKINSFHEKNLLIYYEKLIAAGFRE
ncbi:AIPR family protein [Saccharicrinis sp. FJH54]|uniref:AIPR family protein n=1 Tax=Saccharicrinis sp. FJH54 TaxID=3344665 RepID=UPI0035D49530